MKALLFLAYLVLNWRFFGSRLESLDTAASLLAFLVLATLMAMSIGVVALTRSHLLRWCVGLTVAALSFADSVYFRSVSAHLTYDSYLLMYHSRGSAADAATQFAAPVLYSLPASVCLLLAIGLPGGLPAFRTSALAAVLGFLAAPLVLTLLLFARGGSGGTGLPGGFSVFAYAALSAYEGITSPTHEREPVTLSRQSLRLDHDLVLIIDESVRGDYLDINHPEGVYSGLADLPEDVGMVNLGLAASATNCSVGSNLVLRFGSTRQDYQELLWRIPSIWQYAKSANLATVYIDAQSEHAFFNGMTERELDDIDEIIQFHAVEPLYRDHEAANALVAKINDDIPQLIVVNKLGPHFPVHDKYPDDHMIYTPVLERGSFIDVAVSGRMPQLFDGDWEKYKNSYKNTLVWTIGGFFDRLLQEADFDKALVFYTADHGQYFHERGEPGLRTHCDPGRKPAMEEGVVPLLVLHGKEGLGRTTQEALLARHDKVSHYSVLPTLLELMGYDVADSGYYEASLTRVSDDPYTFNARFYARLGLRPIWTHIDLDKLEGPGTRPANGAH